MREKGSGTRALFDRFIERHHLDIHTACEATCPETFRSAILDNECLAVISVRLLERDIRDGQIRIYNVNTDEFERSFSLVRHKDKVPTISMDTIRDIVNRYQQPDWLAKIPVGTLVK